eukprot:Tamp_23470.p1 GENE.Tamp_23470~~Tamp_23470.p1  ORF type:complete len:221 (+),score=16.39 Tamp_23470:39-665(+)
MDFAPSPEQSATKQSLFEFVTLNHSFLALFFAGPEEAPSVLLPCPCCTSNITKGLSVRNRVFIFCFVVVAMFLVTVCVDLADSEPAWLWIFVWSVIFVLPLTCRMKSELPKLSHRLEPLTVVTGPARAEEVVLFVALLTIVVVAGAKGSFEQAGSLFSDFFGSLLFAMAGEFVSLIWKYFFCSLCCRCCLPPGQSPGYPGEKGATIFV